jgi:preprotein translocase subunit SecD
MRGPMLAAISVAAVLVAGAGCSSSSTKPRAASKPKATLEFRALQYSGENPLIIPAQQAGTGPGNARSCAELVKASERPSSPAREAVLFDRTRTNCYVLGPALLTGDRVDAASAMFDQNQRQWVVDVHFATNEFVTKVAQPLVNRVVAIVLDGVVQTAPTVNPGITGRDVQISGDYTRTEAIAVAAAIRRISPSKVRVLKPEA